jgi:nicotinamide-nucleotide amidase
MDDPVSAAAQLVAQRLRERQLRLVLAESCTAGLVAATLAHTPGISEWLCGSAVVYRLDTKHQWLDVPVELFEPPGPGVVSEAVARAMAHGVLTHTPEAHVAAAITGHLGPNAPVEQDGLVWMAIESRLAGRTVTWTASRRLAARAELGLSVRETRQRLAAEGLLAGIASALEKLAD